MIVCVSGVNSSLAVWRHNKPKNQKTMLVFSTFREILVLVAFCSVLSAGSAIPEFAAKNRLSSPTHKPAITHTSPHNTTLPLSHSTTPYQLCPAPTSRTLQPTHTPSMKIFSTSVPQIFSFYTLERVCLTRVGIPNLGALPITISVSLTHLPCLFACFYESVSCLYAFFSTCLSTCVASSAWFVFGLVFITTFLFSFFFSCEFNTYLWHGALVVSRLPLCGEYKEGKCGHS